MQTVPPNPPAQTTQAEQNTEIRLYLIALELVNTGTTQAWGGPTVRGESDAIGPAGDVRINPDTGRAPDPPFLRLRKSYNAARNWHERQDVIDQARIEVLALKRTAPLHVVGETRKELEARMLEEAVDLTPQLVSQTKQFGLFTARQVVTIRMRADPPRDPETGREKQPHEGDWQTEAARMLAEGYSLNAINFKLPVRRAVLLAWARDRQAA